MSKTKKLNNEDIVKSLTYLFLEYIAICDKKFDPKEKAFFKAINKKESLSESLSRAMNFYGISSAAISDLKGLEQVIKLLLKDCPSNLLLGSMADTFAMLVIDGPVSLPEENALLKLLSLCNMKEEIFKECIKLCFKKHEKLDSFASALKYKDKVVETLNLTFQKLATYE